MGPCGRADAVPARVLADLGTGTRDGDGIADPQDVEDAAAAAMALLCAAGGGDLAESGGLRRAILAYNQSSAYLQSVLSVMATRPVYQLGPVYPWTVAVANVIGSMFGIRSIGGYRAGPDAEDHELGLGLDFMVTADAAGGRALARFVQAHASELGVRYVIWQQHIWNVDRPAEGWRLMEDRGSPTQNHMDHVHVSLFNVVGSLTGLGGSPIAPLSWPTPMDPPEHRRADRRERGRCSGLERLLGDGPPAHAGAEPDGRAGLAHP